MNYKIKRNFMAVSKKEKRRIIDQVFILLGVVVMVVMLVAGGIAWKGYKFATSQVKTELLSQKIYFPPKGSPALDPAEFPDLQQYAGQQVDNGDKAKAYANNFIGKHLEKVAGGKTYSEVSTLAMANPTDQKLQTQKATLFQGETLRGLLLGSGYSYWTMGMLARDAAVAFFVGAAVMAALVVVGLTRLRK
jgi:hypothetical protein